MHTIQLEEAMRFLKQVSIRNKYGKVSNQKTGLTSVAVKCVPIVLHDKRKQVSPIKQNVQ